MLIDLDLTFQAIMAMQNITEPPLKLLAASMWDKVKFTQHQANLILSEIRIKWAF